MVSDLLEVSSLRILEFVDGSMWRSALRMEMEEHLYPSKIPRLQHLVCPLLVVIVVLSYYRVREVDDECVHWAAGREAEDLAAVQIVVDHA